MKQKIQLELQQDEQKLAYLRDSMKRGQKLTDQMNGILSSFDDRLGALETSLLPLHRETVKLSTMQKNVHGLELMLKDIIVFYSASTKHKDRIDDGPRDRLADYLESIHEIDTAITYFKENNTDSPEYEELTKLKNLALHALEREFEELLKRESAPSTREELELLDHGGMLADTSMMLSHDVIATLRSILKHMHSERLTAELIAAYAKVRGGVIKQALDSVAAPFVGSAEPSKKESRRSMMIGRMSVRGKPSRRNSLKGSQLSLGGGSDGIKSQSIVRGHRRNVSNDRNLDAFNDHETSGAVYEKGSHSFVVYSWTIIRAIVRCQR